MRLAVYSRFLEQLKEQGYETVSSCMIARGTGVTPAQVSEDLAYFGEFGTRGVGYDVEALSGHLSAYFGLDRKWPTVLVGAGKLGSALALYEGFSSEVFI